MLLLDSFFLGNHRCLKHSQNCAMHLPHLLSKLDSLPFYPWPDLSENMTSRKIKLCLLKRAPCEHPISGEKRWKENQFFKCKAFQSRNCSSQPSMVHWLSSSIFAFVCLFVCPAMVTPDQISISTSPRPPNPYIF